jgi:hypothetical protein
VQQVPVVRLCGVEGQVVDPGEQAVRGALVEVADVRRERLADQRSVAVVVVSGPGDTDDSGRGGQLALQLTLVEGREQLAKREVAGAPEDGDVAGRQVRAELGGGQGHCDNAKAQLRL